MEIVAEDMGGYCFAEWAWNGGSSTYAKIHLTPNSACTVPRTIIHEVRKSQPVFERFRENTRYFLFQLLHGLSIYHTHTRDDRDEHVRVRWENIQPSRKNEFQLCSGCCCSKWNTKYDCGSVMHYARDQFSLNGRDTMGE